MHGPFEGGSDPPPLPLTHSQGGKPGKFGGNYQIIEGGGGGDTPHLEEDMKNWGGLGNNE